MTISAQQVKELREATGVGMMECKKALVENEGDFERAVRWLRERGLSRAATKAGRTAAEGIVHFKISKDHKEAVLLEVNCETDFSAKNTDFIEFVNSATSIALEKKISSIDDLKKASTPKGTIEEVLASLMAKIGENMTLRRLERLEVTEGLIAGYSHMGGKIATLCALTGKVVDQDKVSALGQDISMHIAAASPRYLERHEVKSQEVQQEKEIAENKLREQGKSPEVIEKALIGALNRYYSEVCLLDQGFVKEQKQTIRNLVESTGGGVKLTGFQRFHLGEGIEVVKSNFADDVAAQLKS